MEKKRKSNTTLKRTIPLHLMLLPGILAVLAFVYVPMLGSVMAFQNYKLTTGFFRSEFVGLDNFRFAMSANNFWGVVRNTLFIAFGKLLLGLIAEVLFALLLNEVMIKPLKKFFQTAIYLPYFMSWVILSGIFINILSPGSGLVNQFLGIFGIEPIYFLGNKTWFPIIMVLTDTWKTFGYGAVIFLAALTGIDKNLYEAAQIDGADRMQQTIHITLPGISTMIILITIMGIGNIFSAGFDQIFNMYSASVYETADIIDTLVYRLAIGQGQFAISAAVGLMKSVVSFILIAIAYLAADKFADYKIF